MKKIIYTLLSVACMLAIGCQKDPYPYITLADVKKIDSLVHPAISGAAFIYNSNVYYISDFTKTPVQITTDGSAAKYVRVSHDHTKFAYINGGNQIMVVGNKGQLLTTLTQYGQVKSFDWSADDKTLYILNGDEMAYYGPALNLPDFDFGSMSGNPEQTVLSASVSAKGDFAYVISSFDFTVGTKYEMVIIPAGSSNIIEYPPSEFDGTVMNYVNFSKNQDLVLGYGGSGSTFANKQKLEFFTGLVNYSSGNYFGDASATPAYNSTLNYLVSGHPNTDGSISPTAIYLGDAPVQVEANVAQTIILNKYNINGVLYIDWK